MIQLQGYMNDDEIDYAIEYNWIITSTYYKQDLLISDLVWFYPMTEHIKRLLVCNAGTPEERYIDLRTEVTKHFQYNVEPITNNNRDYCYICPICGKIHKRDRGKSIKKVFPWWERPKDKALHEWFLPPCIDPDWDLDMFPEPEEESGDYPNFIHIIDRGGINSLALPCDIVPALEYK